MFGSLLHGANTPVFSILMPLAGAPRCVTPDHGTGGHRCFLFFTSVPGHPVGFQRPACSRGRDLGVRSKRFIAWMCPNFLNRAAGLRGSDRGREDR